MLIANVYIKTENYEKAEELYERALEGYEVQHGKDHEKMKRCAKGLNICLRKWTARINEE